jgi:adenylate kinase
MEVNQMSPTKPKAVLLFGPPGAGKGTIGSMICAAGNHYHLSSGQIFRGLPPESDSGEEFYKYASKGNLLPDKSTVDIWWRYTQGLINTNRFYPSQQLFLLDGLPRTVEQAKLISEYVDVIHVIVLQIHDEKEVFRRISRRAKIEKRLDDADQDVITNRLKEYREKTRLVLDHYDPDIISYFNAEQTPMEVLRDVLVGCTHVLKQMPRLVPSDRRIVTEPPPPKMKDTH